MTFSVAFQYQLREQKVPVVYQKYGMAWEASYMRFAQQAITNVAQSFTPKQFWCGAARGTTLAPLAGAHPRTSPGAHPRTSPRALSPPRSVHARHRASRREIEMAMHHAVNRTIYEQGHAQVRTRQRAHGRTLVPDLHSS